MENKVNDMPTAEEKLRFEPKLDYGGILYLGDTKLVNVMFHHKEVFEKIVESYNDSLSFASEIEKLKTEVKFLKSEKEDAQARQLESRKNRKEQIRRLQAEIKEYEDLSYKYDELINAWKEVNDKNHELQESADKLAEFMDDIDPYSGFPSLSLRDKLVTNYRKLKEKC